MKLLNNRFRNMRALQKIKRKKTEVKQAVEKNNESQSTKDEDVETSSEIDFLDEQTDEGSETILSGEDVNLSEYIVDLSRDESNH